MSARAIPARLGVLSILATTLSGDTYPLDLPLYGHRPARSRRRRGGSARRRRERQRREREARRRQRGRR